MAKKTQITKDINLKSIFKKIVAVGLSVILAGGVTAGILCTGFASRDANGKWFGNSNLSTWRWADKVDDVPNTPDNPDNPDTPDNPDKPDDSFGGNAANYGGAIISNIENDGIMLLSAEIPAEAYEANGISEQAETAYSLHATITPAGADDKRVEWTVTPKTGSTNASEYITLTANGLSATVACKKAFDVQFIVTVKSLDNPEAKATCTLDYVERITGVTVNMPNLTSTSASITYTTQSSKYTIKANIGVSLSNFTFNNNFSSGLGDAFMDYGMQISYTPLYPNHSNLVNYTNQGITFDKGSDEAGEDDANNKHCPDNIAGCFYIFNEQDIDVCEATDGDLLAVFRNACAENYIGTVKVTVTATYGGQTYSSVNKTVEIWIEGSAFHIPVGALSLDQGSLIF